MNSGTAWHGVYWTRNTSERPNSVEGSSLSGVLELDAPQKYCLSKKALLGILRRARARGLDVPPDLNDALLKAEAENDAQRLW